MAQLTKVPLERTDDGGTRFRGCSNIREYEILGKLGEGTFGSDSAVNEQFFDEASRRKYLLMGIRRVAKYTERGRGRMALL